MEFSTCLTKEGGYKQTKKHHRLFFKQIEAGDIEFVGKVLDASPEMVNVLGADNQWYRDKSPLMYAFQCGQSEVCQQLIDRDADVDFVMPDGPKTPMCNWAATLAAMYGESKVEFMPILKRVLDLGANPNRCDSMGRDAVLEAIGQYRASGKPRYKTIKLLLDAGADPDRRHREYILRLAGFLRVKRHGQPPVPALMASEVYEMYGIKRQEVAAVVRAAEEAL